MELGVERTTTVDPRVRNVLGVICCICVNKIGADKNVNDRASSMNTQSSKSIFTTWMGRGHGAFQKWKATRQRSVSAKSAQWKVNDLISEAIEESDSLGRLRGIAFLSLRRHRPKGGQWGTRAYMRRAR